MEIAIKNNTVMITIITQNDLINQLQLHEYNTLKTE